MRASASRRFRVWHIVLLLLLAALLWPLAYAMWISLTPSEMLEPPNGHFSGRWYAAFFASPRWTQGLRNSLIVGLESALAAMTAGTALALAGLGERRHWTRLVGYAVLLPLFLPPIVLGMGLLPFVHLTGLWGKLPSISLAHALLGLPVVYLVVKLAVEDLDPDLVSAARGLGASPRRVLVQIMLPLLTPAIAAGGLTAFVLSLNDFFIALFLGTPAIDTLPKIIWPNLRYTLTPLVAAASAITVLITLLILALISWLRPALRRSS